MCPNYEFKVDDVVYRVARLGKTDFIRLSNKLNVLYDPNNPNINRLADAKAPYELDKMYIGIFLTFAGGLLGKIFLEPMLRRIFGK